MRVALQDLEVRQVSQRCGQCRDALVGELVVAQAAGVRGRAADSEGGQTAPGAGRRERRGGRVLIGRRPSI